MFAAEILLAWAVWAVFINDLEKWTKEYSCNIYRQEQTKQTWMENINTQEERSEILKTVKKMLKIFKPVLKGWDKNLEK